MNLILVVIFIGALSLIGYVYYLFLNISIAIWIPHKAKKKWIAAVETPGIQLGYAFFKWIVPLWVVLVTIFAPIMLVSVVLGWLSGAGNAI